MEDTINGIVKEPMLSLESSQLIPIDAKVKEYTKKDF
jgi:hypothetical protein